MEVSPLKRFVQRAAVITAIGSAALFVLYLITKKEILVTLTITCATTCYHFLMRLLVGGILAHSKLNVYHAWFTQRKWEIKLHKILKVKRWKQYVPTYNPKEFSFSDVSANEILNSMCRAELVHEVIILFSFAPIVLTGVLGGFWAFFVTSLMAAAVDSIFVLLQRYNRPRVMKFAKEVEKRNCKDNLEQRRKEDKI